MIARGTEDGSTGKCDTGRRCIPWTAEPFRLCFPLGLLAGMVGVALWPLWALWPDVFSYPLAGHRAILIEGFLGAFAWGFLGTAGPRMLGASPFRLGETVTGVTLLAASLGAHIFGFGGFGHGAFSLGWLAIGLFLARRWRARRDIPPPGVPLVLFGWMAGLFGSILLSLGSFLSGAAVTAAFLLLERAMPLGLILGVGPFLLPRFLGMPSRHLFDETMAPDQAWKRQALMAFLVVACLVISIYLHVTGHTRAGGVGLAVIPGAYLFYGTGLIGGGLRGGGLGWLIRISLACVLLGLSLSVVANYPLSTGLAHIFLAGGIGLMILAVGIRVAWGHGGLADRFQQCSFDALVLGLLVICALCARVAADVWIETRQPWLVVAGTVWIVTLVWWARLVIPALFRSDDD